MTLELDTGKEAESGLVKKLTPDLPPMMPKDELVASAHLLMAQIMGTQGATSEALSYLREKTPQIKGREEEAKLSQIALLIGLGNYDEAKTIFDSTPEWGTHTKRALNLKAQLIHESSQVRKTGTRIFIRPEAVNLMQQSLDLALQEEDISYAAQCKYELGKMHLGHNSEIAIKFLEEAVELAAKVGYHLVKTRALQTLGRCYADMGEYDKAEKTYHATLVEFRNSKQISAYGNTLCFLALLYEKQWEKSDSPEKKVKYYGKARRTYEHAIEEMEKTPEGEIILTKNLYRLYARLLLPTDIETASFYVNKAEEKAKKLGMLHIFQEELDSLRNSIIARAI